MNAKRILTVVLLLFVAISLVQFVIKQIRLRDALAQNRQTETAEGLPKVIVYNFHGNVRCENCENMEAYTKEALNAGFAQEVASGRIERKIVDFEKPENAHYDRELEFGRTTAVVLAQYEGNRLVKKKNLEDVWGVLMNGDKSKFIEYIQNELRDFNKSKE
jgi:hypothetical protein